MTSSSSAFKHVGRFALERFRAFEMRYPKLRSGPSTDLGTIYYLTPHTDDPVGGVRVQYRHVDILNDAGIDAAVLHAKRGFRCSWFEHETRVVDTSSVRLTANDILVVPELYVGMLPELPHGLRHVVFNQGAHLTFRRDAAKVAHHYATSADLLGILTVSDHSRALLQYAFPHLDVHRVRLSVDGTLFFPADAAGLRRIAYMPRRGNADAELVLALLRGRRALEGWEVITLSGLPHRRIGTGLRRASIFLHLAYQEGFGLPAAEAMACANLVVGFHGFGAQEFFRPEFSRCVGTGDVLAMAQTVEEVLANEEEEPGWCRSLGLAASAHVRSHYSPEREQADVRHYYHKLLGLEHDADRCDESRPLVCPR